MLDIVLNRCSGINDILGIAHDCHCEQVVPRADSEKFSFGSLRCVIGFLVTLATLIINIKVKVNLYRAKATR